MTETQRHRAFMQAYQACHEPFARYCSAIAYSKMDAEDLMQDALLSAYRQFDKIENKAQMHHYLIRAAKNRSISIWRKQRNVDAMTDAHDARMRSQGATADELLDIQILYRALDKLPAKQRDAVILFEISGYSMREIAEIQGSSEGAVKTNVSRGRDKLRDILEEDGSAVSTHQLMGIVKSIAL